MRSQDKLTVTCQHCGLNFLIRAYRNTSAKYCSIPCQRARRKDPEVRFWPKVRKLLSCWIWGGTIASTGYGVVRSHPYTLAHRLSYEIHKGEIPQGLLVRHMCQNKLCVNPEHLELGTRADNAQDEVYMGTQMKGEDHGNSKLSESDVDQIRSLYAAGIERNAIAGIYNIHRSHVHRLLHNQSWKS